MSAVWQVRTFRWIYVAFILQASVNTALTGLHGAHEASHGPAVLLVLAGCEIVAALAFLVEPIERIACAGLLAVYATATVLSLHDGDIAVLRFAFYGAAALFVVATRARLRAAATIRV